MFPVLLIPSDRGSEKSVAAAVVVRRAAGRNFFSILDCEPVLESSSNYLEVLFLFFRSFYFLSAFLALLVFLKLFFEPPKVKIHNI